MDVFRTYIATLDPYVGRDLSLPLSAHRAFLLQKNPERFAQAKQAIYRTLAEHGLKSGFRGIDEELLATGVLIFSCTEKVADAIRNARLPYVRFVEESSDGKLYTRVRHGTVNRPAPTMRSF